ncbi:MAG: orotidine 5-phosphate decarboxylase [Anaerosolibacter sp.]|jgi:orotidine-5'-phosphate decarboxylase|uniref:orotidine-5'-phosphate decarboxylase n=1 Tax=Anaerosolibacter sp. TaxID=1872527 RepID=UPI002614DA74|nr:orotidine-5'-phosphate decarboxylase [Anaerosolibacter sp.]MDF2547258.1 orotidine 5-phosphate decarboxylase [Anaerosolibacter sp.]
MFIDRLIQQIKLKKSNIVVGLDPRLDMIPTHIREKSYCTYGKNLRGAAEAVWIFNQEIIGSVHDLVPAVKPQIAFYEQYGLEGLEIYQKTCKLAQEKGLLVIGDVKRGDIGTTSKAYSDAYLGMTDVEGEKIEAFFSDAITVNPYLGDDCLKEFMKDIVDYEKGMFVLVKTSNPTSGQLQDLETEGKKIYEIVARLVDQWSKKTIGVHGYSSIGAVVGATYPEEARNLRRLMPASYFLVPGYGAQGGTAKDIIDCFDEGGLGAIINSSRDILYAYQKQVNGYGEKDFGKAARAATLKMQEAINGLLVQEGKQYW